MATKTLPAPQGREEQDARNGTDDTRETAEMWSVVCGQEPEVEHA